MKTLILNGSPRLDGNTKCALISVAVGFLENTQYNVEFVDIVKYDIKGCMGCNSCRNNNRKTCIIKDDAEPILKKICEADVVIFGSPVYWWGITSQLKALIDRIYCKNIAAEKLKKKIGLISVGAADTYDIEYKLISGQFKCICDYLEWDLVIDEAVSAHSIGDLEKDKNKINELKNLWKNI